MQSRVRKIENPARQRLRCVLIDFSSSKKIQGGGRGLVFSFLLVVFD